MAKLNGLFQFEGTLDGYTVVKTKNGSYLRRKGGLSKERIESDPNLGRVRENLKEFGMVAASSKLIRTAFNGLKGRIHFSSVGGRLSKLTAQIKQMDASSVRGERKVAVGIATAEGKSLLMGFSFNASVTLTAVMNNKFTTDEVTGAITIPGLVPAADLKAGVGANLAGFKAYWAKLDFELNKYEVSESSEVKLALDNMASNVSLVYAEPPAGEGINVMVLAITFYQTVNGVDYILQNGAHNVAQIVAVS